MKFKVRTQHGKPGGFFVPVTVTADNPDAAAAKRFDLLAPSEKPRVTGLLVECGETANVYNVEPRASYKVVPA